LNLKVICKKTDKFFFAEERLYQTYPELRYLEHFFILNGEQINKNISLQENNIKNNDRITLVLL